MAASLAPALVEELMAVAAAAEAAGFGGRTKVYEAAAARLGMSVATLIRHLRQVRVNKPRKRRADAGVCALTEAEAKLIAATVEHTRRLTGTGELRLEQVVETLRHEGRIAAGRVNPHTGEFAPLSLSAIRRALTRYHCHPEQLAQPSAAVALASEHPNHFWQIDASVCRQWYMADDGAEAMSRAVYYRGKPGNFAKINDRRIIRYVITDHCTGYVRLYYCLRGESALNVIAALIHAMTPCEGIVMHGVPRLLGMDKGTESATVRTFCAALGIETWAHAAENPRALGSAECGNNLIETSFEAAMKLREAVTSIDDMNRCAAAWCRWYNATRVHSRHGLTRQDAWLRITPQQLVLAPAPEVLRALATSAPVECTVRDLAIRFKGARWDVRGLPGVLNGAKVAVAINPFDEDTVRVLMRGEDGREQHYLAPRIQIGEWGFAESAAKVGQAFAAMPDTAADSVRKEIARLAADVATDAEAKAARKAKRPLFGRGIDPTRVWEATPAPTIIPRAGTPTHVHAPEIVEPTPLVPSIRPIYEPRVLGHVEMARELRHRIEQRGGTWDPGYWPRMAALWPTGVTEEQLDACAVQLLRGGLQVVGGDA